MNRHVTDGHEGILVYGGFRYGDRNVEGDLILEFCEATGKVICNTWFEKTISYLITYESDKTRTIIDYILTGKENRI